MAFLTLPHTSARYTRQPGTVPPNWLTLNVAYCFARDCFTG